MLDHISSQQLERYRSRVMPPAELLSVGDHLAACEACRARLADTERLRQAVVSLQNDFAAEPAAEPDHLPYEQMAAYVDNRLDELDREIVESHIDLCRHCAAEVMELRGFASEVAAYSEKEYAPAVAPKRNNLLSFTPFGGWNRLGRLAKFKSQLIPLQVAAAAAMIILLVWVAARLLSDSSSPEPPKQAEVTQPSATPGPTPDDENPQPQPSTSPAGPDTASDSTSQSLIALNDGNGLVTLDEQGNISGLKSLPAYYEEAVKAALKSQRVEPSPALAGLTGTSGTLMGSAAEGERFALIGPVRTVVQTTRPTFRWQQLKGARGYTVSVFDKNFNEVIKSGNLTEARWQLPSALERGAIYSWQVTALLEDKQITMPASEAPQAKFKVLEQAKADELERAKRNYAASRLVMGTLYADAGLLDEAEREFQALVNANPQSAIARKLLRSVQAARRN